MNRIPYDRQIENAEVGDLRRVFDRNVPARNGLFYLATPYTKYEGGIDLAHEHAAILAANLLKLGVHVFSPICHTHPVAVLGGIDPLSPIWYELDKPFVEKCDKILVAHMPGWSESLGCCVEALMFRQQNKPIFYMQSTLPIGVRGSVALPFDPSVIRKAFALLGGDAPQVDNV